VSTRVPLLGSADSTGTWSGFCFVQPCLNEKQLLKSSVLCLSRNQWQCMLQVSWNTPYLVEKFKYLAEVSTSDGRHNKGIGTRIDKAIKVRQERYSSVLAKPKLWKTPKLCFWKSVVSRFSPMVIDWVMTKILPTHVQMTEIGLVGKRSRSNTSRQSAQLWIS